MLRLLVTQATSTLNYSLQPLSHGPKNADSTLFIYTFQVRELTPDTEAGRTLLRIQSRIWIKHGGQRSNVMQHRDKGSVGDLIRRCYSDATVWVIQKRNTKLCSRRSQICWNTAISTAWGGSATTKSWIALLLQFPTISGKKLAILVSDQECLSAVAASITHWNDMLLWPTADPDSIAQRQAWSFANKLPCAF